MYFPTVQNCTNGQQALWIDMGTNSGNSPAPKLTRGCFAIGDARLDHVKLTWTYAVNDTTSTGSAAVTATTTKPSSAARGSVASLGALAVVAVVGLLL